MNSPHTKIVRYAWIGLAGLTIGLTLTAAAAASEITTDFADRVANLPPADTSRADATPARLPLAGQPAFASSLLDLDEAELAAAAPGMAAPGTVVGTNDCGESEADTLGASDLAAWLPAAVTLPPGDAAMVDTFMLAIAAIHSSRATQKVCETIWGLPDSSGSQSTFDMRPPMFDLAQRDSYAAAEVAFVLGNVAAPEPDLIFLAFVALQSLWALACRPRQS